MDNKYVLARNLRKNSTPQERKLWGILRNRNFHGLKFKRQQPIDKFIVDFVCSEIKLIIELDGGQHNYTENIISDAERTKKLEELGYRVIRFWNNEVDDIEAVWEELEKFI